MSEQMFRCSANGCEFLGVVSRCRVCQSSDLSTPSNCLQDPNKRVRWDVDEEVLQPKKLTMAVFYSKDCPPWARYAAFNRYGDALYYHSMPVRDDAQGTWLLPRPDGHPPILIGFGYKGHWRESLVKRCMEVPKLTLENLDKFGIKWPEGAHFAKLTEQGELMFLYHSPDEASPPTPMCMVDPSWPRFDVSWGPSMTVLRNPAYYPWDALLSNDGCGAWLYHKPTEEFFCVCSQNTETVVDYSGKVWYASSAADTVEAIVDPWTFRTAPAIVKAISKIDGYETLLRLRYKDEPIYKDCRSGNSYSLREVSEIFVELSGGPCGVPWIK